WRTYRRLLQINGRFHHDSFSRSVTSVPSPTDLALAARSKAVATRDGARDDGERDEEQYDMHALHPQPAALVTAVVREALEEAGRLDDEEQNEEEQPEEHHRIEPPEAKLRQPAPQIELEQHVEA